MREDEFEKRVRGKMEHLGFDPSEAVWTGVDNEIKKEKKRRVPLFWFFFVPGILLAGGAYYFIANKNGAGTVGIISEQQKMVNKQNEEQATLSAEPQKNIQPKTSDQKSNDATGTVKETVAFSGTESKNRKPVSHTGGRRFVGKETHRSAGELYLKNGSGQNSVVEGTDDIVVNHYSDKSANTNAEKVNKEVIDSGSRKNDSRRKGK